MDRNQQIQNILMVYITAFTVLCLLLIFFILNEWSNTSRILVRIKSLIIVFFKREVCWWFLCLFVGEEFFLAGA